MYKITINPHRKIGAINPNIYGHFTEHAFKNIYQGMYDPDSPHADPSGLRTDLIHALNEVKVPLLRYPGGNFVSNYHWEDGIGPKENRKKRFEYAWNTVEDNQFGTNEFIRLCRATNAEPYLCCNMGTGAIEEAMNWVEYCNSDRDTHYANLRRQNGFDEPFNVKYWGLGNECYAPWQMGAAANARDYAQKALEYAKAIRFADPNAYLVACGFESDPDWNIEVLRILKNTINSISVHHYSVDWGCFDLNDYQQLMSISQFVNELLRTLRSAIEAVTGNIFHPIKISLDEWNMFGWANERVNDNTFYTLENGIVTASILNTLIRNCNIVDMANYSVFVNINGAVQTTEQSIIRRPQFYVFKLFTRHMGQTLIDSHVVSDQFQTNMPIDRRVFKDYYNEAAVEKGGRLRADVETHVKRNINWLDSVSTIDEEKQEISISLINKNPDTDLDCTMEIPNITTIKNAQLHTIWSNNLHDSNTENAEPVRIETTQLTNTDTPITLTLPKHSINILKLQY